MFKLFCPICGSHVMTHMGGDIDSYIWCPLASENFPGISGCGWRGKEEDLLTDTERNQLIRKKKLKKIYGKYS